MVKENKGVTWKRNRKRRKQEKNNEGRGKEGEGMMTGKEEESRESSGYK